jgi:tetratricopeptide (TPR) repeat protein
MDEHLKEQLLLGREHFHKQEYDKARELLREVVVKADHYADVHHMLGVIAHTEGEFIEAQLHLERAVELNPNYTEAQLNLIVTYNELGLYEAARRLYAEVRSRDSGRGRSLDPFAMGRIANMHADTSQAYLDAGMTPEAIRELERAVALGPRFADLRTRLGVLYRDAGDRSRAREQFELAVEANPRYPQARIMLGVLLLSAGQAEEAVAHFEQVLETDPDNRSARTYLRIARSQATQEGGSSDAEG